jgi:hypothetical protein
MPKNAAASVRQRLLNLARERHGFESLLLRKYIYITIYNCKDWLYFANDCQQARLNLD